MDIARQEKYKNMKKKFPKKEKISINYELDTLQIMCQYVLCPKLRKSQITNLDKLFSLRDMDAFKIYPDKQKRVRFIKKALRLRIDEGVTNPTLLKQYAEGGYEGNRKDVIQLDIRGELTDEDIKYIDNCVATTLKYAFIHNNMQKIYTLSNKFLARDYPSMDATVEEFESVIDEMVSDFRKVRVQTSEDEKFTLNPEHFTDIMTDVYNEVTDPSSRLYTGIKGLDELFGGGLEGGREYIFAGLAGTGKSLFLLDLALQIKKYNQFFSCKDKSKKPCIVMITMENSLRETIERMVEMTLGAPMADYSIEELINLMRTRGLVLTDQSPIDIIIKSRPNRSEDTNYLYTLTEDLADEGYEVICMLQDHVKRIRAASGQTDIRLELGDVTNEFHNYAVLMDVPIITLTHLNRDAASKIDEACRNNQSDLIKLVGRSNIGESLLMMDNCDGFFLMSKEFDKQGNKYMGVSRVKERYKCTNNSIMFFPYTNPTSIKLLEDKGTDFVAHKTTLLEINTPVRTEVDTSSKNMDEFTDEEKARNLRMKKLEENRRKRLEQQGRLNPPKKQQKKKTNTNNYTRKKSYFDLPCRSDIQKAKEKKDYEKRKSYINYIRTNNSYSKYDYNTDYSYYGMKNGNKIVYRRTEKEYSDCFNYKYYNPYSNKKRNLKVVVRPILPTDNQLLENKVFGYNGDLKVVMKRTK